MVLAKLCSRVDGNGTELWQKHRAPLYRNKIRDSGLGTVNLIYTTFDSVIGPTEVSYTTPITFTGHSMTEEYN